MSEQQTYENGSMPGRLACEMCSSEFPAGETAAHEATPTHRRMVRESAPGELRDMFAGLAIAAIVSPSDANGIPLTAPTAAAEMAYDYADAMLARRLR